MPSPADQVRDEMERFRAKLPTLLGTIPGRWVVFRDGEVTADFANEGDAYAEAIRLFGLEGGFVIARVAEERPAELSPLFIYRLA